MPGGKIEWYNYNIPREQWTTQCPEHLRDVSDKDRSIIGTREEEYQIMSWETVKHLIDTNAIDQLQRTPYQLRCYRLYVHQLQQEYTSVMQFIIPHRLHWNDLTPSGPPFSNPTDIKVRFNDWPYGIDERIVHLVVWVKFELDDDPITGLSTPESARQINDYIDETFRSRMQHPEHVIWFKNWKSLKSIHAVEHFHVLLMDPDPALVRAWTENDAPCRVVPPRNAHALELPVNASTIVPASL